MTVKALTIFILVGGSLTALTGATSVAQGEDNTAKLTADFAPADSPAWTLRFNPGSFFLKKTQAVALPHFYFLKYQDYEVLSTVPWRAGIHASKTKSPSLWTDTYSLAGPRLEADRPWPHLGIIWLGEDRSPDLLHVGHSGLIFYTTDPPITFAISPASLESHYRITPDIVESFGTLLHRYADINQIVIGEDVLRLIKRAIRDVRNQEILSRLRTIASEFETESPAWTWGGNSGFYKTYLYPVGLHSVAAPTCGLRDIEPLEVVMNPRTDQNSESNTLQVPLKDEPLVLNPNRLDRERPIPTQPPITKRDGQPGKIVARITFNPYILGGKFAVLTGVDVPHLFYFANTPKVPTGYGVNIDAEFAMHIESWKDIDLYIPKNSEGRIRKKLTKAEAAKVIETHLNTLRPSADVMLGIGLHINNQGFQAEIDEIQEWLVSIGIRNINFRVASSSFQRQLLIVRKYRDDVVFEPDPEDELDKD